MPGGSGAPSARPRVPRGSDRPTAESGRPAAGSDRPTAESDRPAAESDRPAAVPGRPWCPRRRPPAFGSGSDHSARDDPVDLDGDRVDDGLRDGVDDRFDQGQLVPADGVLPGQ
ncbi:hypothetical protein DEI91_04435 [Curtobacterium sp. MCBD17_032]|nr:hypothetical protein DEI91_04435 [Curtobacterium sp. MCBD17_032]